MEQDGSRTTDVRGAIDGHTRSRRAPAQAGAASPVDDVPAIYGQAPDKIMLREVKVVLFDDRP